MPAWLAPALAGVLGAVVGSFLNVCIYRLPRRESVVWPGSRCTSCERRLAWFENIPVLAWVALGGRCRSCRARVSPVYPVVELVTALTFVGTYALYGATPLGLVRVAFACALIVLFVIDLQHQILPDAITLPGIVVGFLCSVLLPPGWRDSLLGIVVGGGIPFAIAEAYYRIRGHDGLGMGDVKLLGMIGAFLGWQLAILTLVIASFAGSVAGAAVLLSGRGGMKHALPFGTFLALGAAASAAWGEAIIAWYAGFYV